MSYLKFPKFPPLPVTLIEKIFHIIANQKTETHDDLLINSTPEVIDIVKNVYKFTASDSDLGYTNQDARRNFPGLVKYHFFDVTDDIKFWVAKNIPVHPISVNIQVMEGGDIVAPHIDEIRNRAINYILSTGGENASLNFYDLKDPADLDKLHPQMFIPYEKLELKETNFIKENIWHILPTNKIHSVENIDPKLKRISLSISLANE